MKLKLCELLCSVHHHRTCIVMTLDLYVHVCPYIIQRDFEISWLSVILGLMTLAWNRMQSLMRIGFQKVRDIHEDSPWIMWIIWYSATVVICKNYQRNYWQCMTAVLWTDELQSPPWTLLISCTNGCLYIEFWCTVFYLILVFGVLDIGWLYQLN